MRRSASPGSSDMARKLPMSSRAKIAGTTVMAKGPGAVEEAEVEPEPEDDDRAHVDRVEQGQEGDHPAGHHAGLHPRAPQGHAVSAMPPAPAAANRRVAATPAIVIS
jgi:hypothetical protein